MKRTSAVRDLAGSTPLLVRRTPQVAKTLGAGFMARERDIVFTLGTVSYARASFVEMTKPFPSTRCAKRLQAVCKELGITSVAQLADTDPLALATPGNGVGDMTLWTAMSVLDQQGYSVERWFGWQQPMTLNKVTWSTLKSRVRAQRAADSNASKRPIKRAAHV